MDSAQAIDVLWFDHAFADLIKRKHRQASGIEFVFQNVIENVVVAQLLLKLLRLLGKPESESRRGIRLGIAGHPGQQHVAGSGDFVVDEVENAAVVFDGLRQELRVPEQWRILSLQGVVKILAPLDVPAGSCHLENKIAVGRVRGQRGRRQLVEVQVEAAPDELHCDFGELLQHRAHLHDAIPRLGRIGGVRIPHPFEVLHVEIFEAGLSLQLRRHVEEDSWLCCDCTVDKCSVVPKSTLSVFNQFTNSTVVLAGQDHEFGVPFDLVRGMFLQTILEYWTIRKRRVREEEQ